MSPEIVGQVLLDALKDSAISFAFVFLFHIIISLFEDKLATFLTKRKGIGPLFGSIFGLIPQCGTSVLAADLYIKKYITIGTIIAVFLSCNDEALIVLISGAGTIKGVPPQNPWWMILVLICIKFVIGFIVGIIADLIFNKQEIVEPQGEIKDVTCEGHHHENTKLHKHFLHPLFHSLEIFIYVFIASALLGLIIQGVGEDAFKGFLTQNKYLSPLFASIVGLIPNCSGSVLLSTLYNSGTISFGALVGGLLVNSGLGILMLFKSKKTIKSGLFILISCFLIGILVSYIICLIGGF